MSVAHKMIKRHRKRKAESLGPVRKPLLVKKGSFNEEVDNISFMKRMRSFDIEKSVDPSNTIKKIVQETNLTGNNQSNASEGNEESDESVSSRKSK